SGRTFPDVPVAPLTSFTVVAPFLPALPAAVMGLVSALIRLLDMRAFALVARIDIFAIIVEILIIAAEALLLLFLPGAIVGEDAEIMIGELKIIFSVHPIARHLGITRHILIFFKKLCRVSPRATVDPVPVVAAAPVAIVGTPVVPAAIAATGLPVVDQDLVLAFTMIKFTEDTVQSPFPSSARLSGRIAPPDRDPHGPLPLAARGIGMPRHRDFKKREDGHFHQRPSGQTLKTEPSLRSM